MTEGSGGSSRAAGNRPLSICFVAPHAYPLLAEDSGIGFAGGAELQQVLIAKGLVARGYSVSMVCLDYGQPDACRIGGVTVNKAYRPHSGLPVIRFFWPRLSGLWGGMKRADADVYYQRVASMLTGLVAIFCKRHRRKGIFAMAGRAVFGNPRDRWLFRYGIRHIDRIVVQTDEQRRHIHEEFGRDSELIRNVQPAGSNPVDAQRKYVLWVGMIRRIKRPDLFLDLVEALPDLDFVMVGGPSLGEQALFEQVSARAATLENLRFAGFVPYAKVGAYFDAALLFVNTSDSEGFPNTFLQAWVRSTATVSFVDSGARFDGAPVGIRVLTSAEMVETVASLAADGAQRSTWERAGKAYAERHHGPDAVLDQYESLLGALAPDPAAPRV